MKYKGTWSWLRWTETVSGQCLKQRRLWGILPFVSWISYECSGIPLWPISFVLSSFGWHCLCLCVIHNHRKQRPQRWVHGRSAWLTTVTCTYQHLPVAWKMRWRMLKFLHLWRNRRTKESHTYCFSDGIRVHFRGTIMFFLPHRVLVDDQCFIVLAWCSLWKYIVYICAV